MHSIDSWFDRFCRKHPRLAIPNLMLYIVIGTAIVYILDQFGPFPISNYLAFNPYYIIHGQVWRLITFIFVPLNTGASSVFGQTFLFALSTFFYYWIGTALERQWGTTRFTVFYGLGVIFNIIVGFIVYAVLRSQLTAVGITSAQIQEVLMFVSTASMSYVNMSMFFSFATLYPDMQVLLYGIIPLKVKWLAWLDVVFFVWEIGSALFSRQWIMALVPIIAILNYLFFFWEDLVSMVNRGRVRVQHRTSAQTINFKKAQKDLKERRGYLHKCSVCGITDQDDPNMEFRYCSKCNGYYCYCANHINNHTHIQ